MKLVYFLLATVLCPLGVEAQNKVSVQPDATQIKYNKMIFGHFIEHFDNQVYGGIYDPQSKFADEDGFRTDVIDALKQIKVPIVRWPGGCFVSTLTRVRTSPSNSPLTSSHWA